MRTIQPALLSVVLWLLSASGASAQTRTGDAAPPKSFADEPYIIEHLSTVVRLEADGRGQRESVARIRIQSESAVRDFGLLVYPFMASFETLDVVYVRVRKPDASVVETPASDVQELDSAVSREAPMYTDQREKHIAVKALSVGDVLETDLKWTVHDPVAPGHFWFDDSFFSAGICLDETLEVNVPADIPIKVSASNPAPETRLEGARKIYSFHTSHLEKARASDKPGEDEIPAWEKNVHGMAPPSVRFTSFSSWADVGAWYGGLQQSRIEVTPRIRATAGEITKDKGSEEQKIRAIYDYVSSRIRYIGIDLGYGRYTPHAAEDVLGNRYGDCKDKHTLFAALLASVGIHAYAALISWNYKIDPTIPSASLFDHVITAIPRGDSYLFLDTTPEVAPFGLLLPGLRDRQALVMPDGTLAKLVTTPADPPVLNRESFRMEASLDPKGTLEGKARFEEAGDSEVSMRAVYRNTAPNRWTELTQNLVARLGFAGTVSGVAALPPEKTSEPFWVTYDYHRPTYGDWEHHQITLPFPPLFLPELNEAQKKSKEPLPLGSPQEVVYEASIKLPEGITPFVPPDVDQKYEFAEYAAKYSFESGVLRGSRRFAVKSREVSGSRRDTYTSFVKSIREDADHWIVLLGDFEATNPLRKAWSLLRQGKPAEAVPLLEKAFEQEPDNNDIAFALGTAYVRTDQAVRASAQFQKLLADKPSAETLNAIAYEYVNANRRLSDAQGFAARAVAITSEETTKVSVDSAVADDYLRMTSLANHWDTFGWAKFRAGDLGGAEKYVEAAWLLWQRAVIGKHLAEIYEKLNKKREADHVCRLALAAPGLDDEPFLKEKLQEMQKRLGISRPETATGDTRGYRPPSPGGIELSEMRAAKVQRKIGPPERVRNALFVVGIDNGNNSVLVRFVSGDEELKAEAEALALAHFHQPFPDGVPARILRAGWLSCSKFSTDCTLVFFQADDKTSLELLNKRLD